MGGLIWYENPLPAANPAAKPWAAHQVADHRTHDIELADLDKDGRLDIISRDQSDFGANAGDKVYLWRQEAGDKWGTRSSSVRTARGLPSAIWTATAIRTWSSAVSGSRTTAMSSTAPGRLTSSATGIRVRASK